MDKVISINTGELAVDKTTGIIKTSSIGSCVAIVIYDAVNKVGGMAHAMLPGQAQPATDMVSEARSKFVAQTASPAKYVDQAIDNLVKEIVSQGGNKANLKAKITGGAKMFKVLSGDKFGIGYKNAESAKNKLKSLGIMLESEDTGGTVGRLAELNLENGLVEVVTRM